MAEILASIEDVNAHLPINAQINNSVDAQLQVDAFRLIRGQLVSILTPAVINTWISPATTPELIRSIAGRLVASKYYANLFAAESADEMPTLSIALYNQALSLLADIKSGNQILVDADGNPLATDDIGSDPLTDVNPSDNNPVFTMTRVLS